MPTFISKHLYKGGTLTEELEFPLEKWNRFSTTIGRGTTTPFFFPQSFLLKLKYSVPIAKGLCSGARLLSDGSRQFKVVSTNSSGACIDKRNGIMPSSVAWTIQLDSGYADCFLHLSWVIRPSTFHTTWVGFDRLLGVTLFTTTVS